MTMWAAIVMSRIQWRIQGGGVRGVNPPPSEVGFFFACQYNVYENSRGPGP